MAALALTKQAQKPHGCLAIAGLTVPFSVAGLDPRLCRGLLGCVPAEHSEQVAWLVQIGEQVQAVVQAGGLELVAHVTQRRKILDRKAERNKKA